MKEVRNLEQLVKEKDGNAKIAFGKHRGKTVSDVPKDYVKWAKEQLLVEKTRSPERVYNLYCKCVEKTTGVPINLPFRNLSKEEKKLWEIFSDKVKKL